MPLHAEAKNLLLSIPNYILEHIPRAQNGRADELSNVAMDRMTNSTEYDHNEDQMKSDASAITTESYSHALQLLDLSAPSVLTESKSDSDSDSDSSDSDSYSESDEDDVPSRMAYMDMERTTGATGGMTGEINTVNLALGIDTVSIEPSSVANVLESDIIFNESDHTLTITVSVSELLFHKLKEASAKNPQKLKKQLIIIPDTSPPKSDTDSASKLIGSAVAKIKKKNDNTKSVPETKSIRDTKMEDIDEDSYSHLKKKIKKEKVLPKVKKIKVTVPSITQDDESASNEKEIRMKIQ